MVKDVYKEPRPGGWAGRYVLKYCPSRRKMSHKMQKRLQFSSALIAHALFRKDKRTDADVSWRGELSVGAHLS